MDSFLNVEPIRVRVDVFSESPHPLPEYAHLFDSGMDVQAWTNGETISIQSRQHEMIHTGIYVAIPPGLEIQVRPRSGLAKKLRVSIVNAPGTIDSPYRGECCVLVENRGDDPFIINEGDKIAQFVLAPVYQCVWNRVASKESLPESQRGEGGFGSTGVSVK